MAGLDSDKLSNLGVPVGDGEMGRGGTLTDPVVVGNAQHVTASELPGARAGLAWVLNPGARYRWSPLCMERGKRYRSRDLNPS